ncbi:MULTISPECIES: DUF3422 domain-containing protein [unclassified Ensifer]|uniref:DUF3422 domain-containing protein n=1 Tax=unclassified Ensifer TaxID=2633371 RepID=UPI00177EDC78|nr:MULTISPECIES: DUF3422 domain-containing protein [unclassified Ensifer]MBD9497873.1 DUF3422 domain-containing protein [Ensifer sp. ENS01]MBD9561117.1 DUF3422 domain-containing protein [Ensifer sp. ENS03]
MSSDFNAELHARPSIYFTGPSLVEHVALMPTGSVKQDGERCVSGNRGEDDSVRTQVEYHTEFVTVTRVTTLEREVKDWPTSNLSMLNVTDLIGASSAQLVCRIGILVLGPAPSELGPTLLEFGFRDTAASSIGGGAAQVCSDFRVRDDQSSRILLFNKELNAYRLGRMVRRVCEIETYRSMALLGLPEARRLAPLLRSYDRELVELTNRHQSMRTSEHRTLLEDISRLSGQIISASAETRNRFGASSAYAKIVEERIRELRETHVPGFQRFGVFVARRFKPAVRTCEASALRLDQLSNATMHLIDLLQTRIQVEIEYQNAVQIQAVAERAATQVKIQRAVEGFSIIAISYYLLGLLKILFETGEHAGYHVSPMVMLVSIPLVIGAVSISVLRIKHALSVPA